MISADTDVLPSKASRTVYGVNNTGTDDEIECAKRLRGSFVFVDGWFANRITPM
jgi:hypothetical protein